MTKCRVNVNNTLQHATVLAVERVVTSDPPLSVCVCSFWGKKKENNAE